MPTYLISVMVLLLLGCGRPGSTGAQQPAEKAQSRIDSTGLTQIVDSAMAQGMARESIPGAAFILVQNGRVILAKGYGEADTASGRAPS